VCGTDVHKRKTPVAVGDRDWDVEMDSKRRKIGVAARMGKK